MVSALHLNLRACAATQRLSSYPCPTQAFLGSKLFFFVDQNYHSLIGWTLGMVWDHTTTLASLYTYLRNMNKETDVEEKAPAVHLGFVETIENEGQLRRLAHRSADYNEWDGGQVGGCPSFLDPQHIPDSPQCGKCDGTMNFVCQLYAPIDEYEERAFHRSFYVFACSKCQNDSTETIRVYRCQLPQQNPYFPSDPSQDAPAVSVWKQHLPATHNLQLCQVCGMRGKYKCPLQQLYFCGKDHQKEYKKHIFDKIKNGQVPSDLPSVYPLAELVVDAEILPTTNNTDNDKRETLFETNDDDDDSDADLEQEDLNRMTGKKGSVEQDPFTQTFMQRIKSQPDQALRYARWQVGEDASDHKNIDEVLWIRKDYRPTAIPACPYCGAPRRFEFQLMPQMLDHLNRNASIDQASNETYQQYKNTLQQAEDLIRESPPEAIPPALVENKERAAEKVRQYLLKQRKSTMEFGVVAVYTCTKSCGTMQDLEGLSTAGGDEAHVDACNLAYREEFAWRQPCLDLS